MARKPKLLYPYPGQDLPQEGDTFHLEGVTWVVVAPLLGATRTQWDRLILARRRRGRVLWMFGLVWKGQRLFISQPLAKWP